MKKSMDTIIVSGITAGSRCSLSKYFSHQCLCSVKADFNR